jgi:hypothetical protein
MCRADVRCSGLTALILVFMSVACSREPAPAAQASAAAESATAANVETASPAVSAPGTGWIEGTITDTNGNPPYALGAFDNGVSIALKADGKDLNMYSDPAKGGFFSFRNLKPGLYEVFIDAARPPRGGSDRLRPVRVSGVAVEAGKRTILNVKMQPGKELEEIGKPAMATQEFVVLSEELKRLQAQIDELKKK